MNSIFFGRYNLIISIELLKVADDYIITISIESRTYMMLKKKKKNLYVILMLKRPKKRNSANRNLLFFF